MKLEKELERARKEVLERYFRDLKPYKKGSWICPLCGFINPWVDTAVTIKHRIKRSICCLCHTPSKAMYYKNYKKFN